MCTQCVYRFPINPKHRDAETVKLGLEILSSMISALLLNQNFDCEAVRLINSAALLLSCELQRAYEHEQGFDNAIIH